MRGSVIASIFVCLGVHYTDSAQLDFRRLNALLIEKLQDDFLSVSVFAYTEERSSPASL